MLLGKKEMLTIIQKRFNVCENIKDSNDHTEKLKTCYCFLLLFCLVFVRKHGDADDQTKKSKLCQFLLGQKNEVYQRSYRGKISIITSALSSLVESFIIRPAGK